MNRRSLVASLWAAPLPRALSVLLAAGLLACGLRPPADTRMPTAATLPAPRAPDPGDGIDDVDAAALETADVAATLDKEDAPPPMTELRLPWSAGETWYLTSGPHSGKRAALDFAPPNVDPRTGKLYPDSCSRKRGDAYWVRAAADGVFSAVLRNGCPCVQIQHADGTTTNYFHLRRSSVKRLGYKVGDVVRAGQALGHPSCEVGPSQCGATHPASGVHVHFHRTNAATHERLPADGVVLSGWTVKAVGRERDGVMTKGDDVRQTRGKLVGWACSPSTQACAGKRNDLESDNAAAAEETPAPAPTMVSLERQKRP